MKWISKGKRKKYSLKRLFKSFGYAGRGIFSAFKTEQNLTVHLIATIIAIVAGVYFKISTVEWCIIVLTIALVIGLEMVNTAIEYTIDMAMPNIHPLAKIAKDVASGAVLVSAIASLVIAGLIFVPKIILLF